MDNVLNVGLDIGSTTVKAVVMRKNEVIYTTYKRHFSDTKNTVINVINEIINKYADKFNYSVIFTGSGAISLSEYIGLPFVQEVIACKNAVEKYADRANVAIELGGEDAKIIYFEKNNIEQRMNGTCAGGTGAFLDQMAVLLNTDTEGLNELAKKGQTIYTIASRCGVFAKSDIQPLINEGAKKEDIALSIMQAVVNQTISGLACGKPIRGNVIFLGGPLNYLSELKKRFVETLNLKPSEVISPEDAHVFVCKGATLNNEVANQYSRSDILKKIELLKKFTESSTNSLEPLFNTDKAYDEFVARHSKAKAKYSNISSVKDKVFVGIDAGSTTAKLIALDENKKIVYSNYKPNQGSPVKTIKVMLEELYSKLPVGVEIAKAGSTGYGEALVKAAFNLDISEIETIAHYTAAEEFYPGVESIVDIGGQDMKYIKIKDGAVDTIMLNEACSSGCGSFIETLAKSLKMSVGDFVSLAIKSKEPVDLGSRCTVFMNSKIKQTQKEGKSLEDIFAGLSYSVVKNAISKVMKMRDTSMLGDKIVVQGGTFLNDAVLKSFENITGKEVIRPDIAGLMGAYGMAIISLEKYNEEEKRNNVVPSTIISKDNLALFRMETTEGRCKGCSNNCRLTISKFNDKRYISGNRCEKATGNNAEKSEIPNMYKYKYDRLFGYKSLEEKEAKRGIIGIPRVLNMYENYPFWHTFLTKLGFSVVLSDDSTRKIYEKGIETIPSESACYPAKMVHGHIENLIGKGVKTIFYPCIMYENKEFSGSDNSYNCPIVMSYPEAIKLNVESLQENSIKYINPFLPLKPMRLVTRVLRCKDFKKYDFKINELIIAAKEALKEQKRFKEDIANKGKEVLDYLEKNSLKGIVLAGRPYHLDKEVNHGIDTLITGLGLAVLTEDSVCYKSKLREPLRVVDQWTYHSRLYHAADVVSKMDNIELVNLNSFGCGLDAIITDQVEEILKINGKMYTTIKIDEVSNLGAVRIRIRSLIASMNRRCSNNLKEDYIYDKKLFTEDMKKEYTILCPDMSKYHMRLFEPVFKSAGYNFKYLENTTDDMINEGLKYVNNDACYPSIIVIGQLIHALKSGKYDKNKTAVIISQTGGGCRATNYIGLIRKALKDAGFEYVPVISFNLSGMEKDQAFKITPIVASKLLMAVVYGDLLAKLLHATRPYEVEKGKAEEVYNKWNNICKEALTKGMFYRFRKNIKGIVNDFNGIEIKNTKKVKVGIVGEILIKYNEYGNNNIVKQLEKEGAEIVVPELMGFVKYVCYNGIAKTKLLIESAKNKVMARLELWLISLYERPVRKYLKGTRFKDVTNIRKLAKNVKPVLSTGNQTGEGWFLTAEMIELIKNGVTNIACVQPFACLPNHIVGKAVIKKLRAMYPESNIVPIDYDPGASKTNQSNRIKLMMTVAKENMKKGFKLEGKQYNNEKSKNKKYKKKFEEDITA